MIPCPSAVMLVSPLPSPKSLYAVRIPTANLAVTPAPTETVASFVPIPTFMLGSPEIQL